MKLVELINRIQSIGNRPDIREWREQTLAAVEAERRWALRWKAKAKELRKGDFWRNRALAVVAERDELRRLALEYLDECDKLQDDHYIEENFHREDLYDAVEKAAATLRAALEGRG